MAAGLPSVRQTSKDRFNSAQPERQATPAVLALARRDVQAFVAGRYFLESLSMG